MGFEATPAKPLACGAKDTIRKKSRCAAASSEVTRGNLTHTAKHVPMLFHQVWRYKIQRRAYAPPEVRIFLRIHCEQEPTSRSSITLTDQRDPLGLFRTRFDWQISERELETIRQYVLIAQRSLAGIATIIPDEDLMSGSPNFLTRCDDSNHHMGGMRMSTSETTGIVDPNLRLFGTSNAYICSSAVFPCSGFSNPTHTITRPGPPPLRSSGVERLTHKSGTARRENAFGVNPTMQTVALSRHRPSHHPPRLRLLQHHGSHQPPRLPETPRVRRTTPASATST